MSTQWCGVHSATRMFKHFNARRQNCMCCVHSQFPHPSQQCSKCCLQDQELFGYRIDLCLQDHTSASITGRRESSPSLRGSSWSSCRPPVASRKSTAVLYCEHACSGHEVRENVDILYLGRGTHIRTRLATLIKRIGVVLEGETGYFQFLLISLLAVLIQNLKEAIHGFPQTMGTRFCPLRGVTRTSKRTCLLAALMHVIKKVDLVSHALLSFVFSYLLVKYLPTP